MAVSKKKKTHKNHWDFKKLEASLLESTQPTSKKEQQILEAASSLFARQGKLSTSTAEIARAASTTERTLFRYFPTKEHLVRRILIPIVIKTILPSRVEAVIKILRQDWSDPRLFFKTLYYERLKSAEEVGGKMKFLLSEMLQNPTLKESMVEFWKKTVFPEACAVVANFQKQGKVRNDIAAEELTRMVLTTLMGHIMMFSILPEQDELISEKSINHVMDFLLEGIKA